MRTQTRRSFYSVALSSALLGALVPLPNTEAQVSLVRTGGTLGQNLQYQLTGVPGALCGLLPSLSAGPTPLALLDPLDPRVLSVGLELSSVWSFGVLDGLGQRTVAFPLPVLASLSGVPLYAQALTFPGATTLVADLSNGTAVALGAVNSSVATPAPAPAGWAGHTATTLPDGRVLIAGGTAYDGAGNELPANGLYLFDPQAGAFSALPGTLVAERVAHTATLLADGRVLVVGGTDATGVALNSAEVVNPATGTSTATGTLSEPRVAHTATLLADGRVFVAGGTQNFDFTDPLAGLLDVLQSTRLWNPGTGQWTAGANLPARRLAHAATRLPNGNVLVSGGLVVTVFLGIPLPSISTDCRIYNPTNNTMGSAAGLIGARAFHAQTLLPDGRVLVAGGADGDVVTQVFNTRSDALVYNPAGNSWAGFGNFPEARAYGQLSVSGNGQRVVLSSGVATVDLASGGGSAAATIAAANLPGGGWSTVGAQLQARPLGAAALIDGGRRILTTGAPQTVTPSFDLSAEMFVLF